MNERNIIYLEPGTPDFNHLVEALAVARDEHRHVRFLVEQAHSEPVFDKGDVVTVHFDAGPGKAKVQSADEEFVKIRYLGMDDRRDIAGVPLEECKYTTSLPRGSVVTSNRREYPAVLKFKVGEGSWTPGIKSHRPNGGY